MNLAKIKVEKFPKRVLDFCEETAVNTSSRFCAYLEYINGEIVERSFGYRRYAKHGVRITEVLRCATGSGSPTISRNLVYASMGGYIPIWSAEDKYGGQAGWRYKVFAKEDFDVWEKAGAHIGFSFVTINPEMIFEIPEFKYCGYSGGGVISYINAYRKDKSVEFFGKMGLSLSPILMKKAKADGKFRRFLFENHNAISLYGTQAALFAYKNGITVEEARRACHVKNQLDRLVANRIPEIVGTRLDRQRVLDYVDSNDINYSSYSDYLKCLKDLKLDLNDTKNIYPKDFQRMHELRTAEYAANEAKIDRRKRAKLYREFRKAGEAAKEYEVRGEEYVIIVPTDVRQLVDEGKALSHCVGRMGYDKKMADGVSIIAFVRKKDEINVPFVTVEYRVDRQALAQCYGYKDSRPEDDVIKFCEDWSEMVKGRMGIHNVKMHN
jgi:hypothetical protein